MGKINTKKREGEVAPSRIDAVDRIILRREERDRLDRWLAQLNEKFDGMIKFSKSDIANFLIRAHEDELDESEIKLMGAQHYDEMRWYNRAAEKVRQAKRKGIEIAFEDLMAKRKPIEKMKSSLNKKGNKKRDKSANGELYIKDQIENMNSEIAES
jgi:hypothetical protein